MSALMPNESSPAPQADAPRAAQGPAVQNPVGKKKKPRERRWELDALRGLMLIMMLSTHLPTRFADPFGQPFGFVSAAEGFVVLSAYMAGMIYTQRAMRDAFLKRALVIYACQAACLLFLFSVIAYLGEVLKQHDVSVLMWYYLFEPVTAFWASLLLIYNPPLLDILPLYIIFMLLSPFILLIGLKYGWRVILSISGGLWLGAQFGLSRAVYDATVALTGLPVPFSETGAFDTFAWQFLWIFGLWIGARHARIPKESRGDLPKWLAVGAAVVFVVFIVWRHSTGHVPFEGENAWNMLFDKWRLGPLRLLDFFAMVTLLIYFETWLKRGIPRPRWLETMGAASLPVFCAHLVIVLIALGVFGHSTPERPVWLDMVLFVGSVLALYWVARAVLAAEAAAARRTASATGPAAGVSAAAADKAAVSPDGDAGKCSEMTRRHNA